MLIKFEENEQYWELSSKIKISWFKYEMTSNFVMASSMEVNANKKSGREKKVEITKRCAEDR